MAYGLSFTFLLLASLAASLAGFVWALRSGQFSDQDRARFLPLRDPLPGPRVRVPAGRSPEVYALAAIFLFGVGLLAAAVWIVLSHGKAG